MTKPPAPCRYRCAAAFRQTFLCRKRKEKTMKKLASYLALLTVTAALCAACGQKPAVPEPTPVPTGSSELTPTDAATLTPTPAPTEKPEPTKPPFSDTVNLLNTYGKTFGYNGTCINYSQLKSVYTLKLVKAQYNSVTLENEMKPDALLGQSPTLISIEEAKKLGYVIPENYTDSTVPKLHFETTDDVLKLCAENGLGLRAHTLVWHSQTPAWFFRTDYTSPDTYVSKEVMDARLEFYIRTVMSHVYDNENGGVVYAWDVVNEYLHAENSGWEAVYGDEGLTPSFVKLAYEIADDVLEKYEIRDKVSLFFNDFNTYMEVTEMLSVMNFINAEEKICDGIGMQAHLDTGYPSTELFKSTLQSFLNAGYEIQITELDVTNQNEDVQAEYFYNLMSGILEAKKAGGNITGITYWGLADNVSWRESQSPLLFYLPSRPKPSYYQVLQAYADAGFPVAE